MARNYNGSSLCSAVSSTLDIILTDNDGLALLGKCIGAAPSTANLFSHGCLMVQIDTGAGNSALYENTGTSAVPVWDLVTGIVPSSISLDEGQVLVGNTSNVATATTAGAITLKSLDGGATGVVLTGYHDSTSPSVSDIVLDISGQGNDDAGNSQVYGQIQISIADPTSGSEWGLMKFLAAYNGTNVQALNLFNDGTNSFASVGSGTSTGIVQSRGLFDLILRTGNPTTGSITIEDGANGAISITPNGSGITNVGGASGRVNIEGFTSINGPMSVNDIPVLYSASGAVSIDKTIINVATTAGAVALTLADATVGRMQLYVMTADDGTDVVLTPTNLVNGTTITFNDVGDTALLYFGTGGWGFYGGTATLA